MAQCDQLSRLQRIPGTVLAATSILIAGYALGRLGEDKVFKRDLAPYWPMSVEAAFTWRLGHSIWMKAYARH